MGDVLSTADARRDSMVESAIAVFAQRGLLGTPIAAVAKHAGISSAYVFKLFPSKESLFVAALERCFELIQTALREGADACLDSTPEALLYSMGGSYAALIADRNLLMLQVHAQSVAEVPEIGLAFREGLKTIVQFVKERSGAPDADVQRFFAYGQLCHLIVTTSLDDEKSDWANLLTNGIRHPA